MGEILDKILQIEKDAQNILKETNEECLKIKESINIEKENIIKQIEIDHNNKLKTINEAEKTKFTQKIAEIEEEQDKKIKALQKVYDENRSKWVEEIVFNVIKQ